LAGVLDAIPTIQESKKAAAKWQLILLKWRQTLRWSPSRSSERYGNVMNATALLLLLCAGTLCAQSSTQQQPPSKEALLIANGDYTHFGRLPNPVSDARVLAQSLKKVGFEVTLVENKSREGMLDALQSFQDRLKASHGIALFHYGGHGVQVNGRNYLIPVDADIPDERKVTTRAVDLEEVMTTLDASGSQVNVVVLDACRDNPLPASSTRSASRGLSLVQTQPKHSLIIYAAKAGQKAEDGLFTPTLATVLTEPGLSLSQVVMKVRREVEGKSNGNQTPGDYSELSEDVYLAYAESPQLIPDNKSIPKGEVKKSPVEFSAYSRPAQNNQQFTDNDYPVLAKIYDPDGYTNIRKGPNTNSEVICTVKDGDTLLVHPDTSRWWRVKTESEAVGFIHKSRLIFKKYYVTGLNPNGDNWLALKSGPDLKATRLCKLPPETPLTLLSCNGEWMRVLLDDGQEGWVYSKYVKTR